MQPGSSIDDVLQGVGYPEPIMPASLLPNDNFTKMKKQYAEMGLGRSNTRFGWMRTQRVALSLGSVRRAILPAE